MSRSISVLAVLLLVAAAFGPRIHAVGKAAGGLPQWTVRAERFWDALADGRLADTFVATHPGLTQLWTAGAAIRLSGAATPRERLDAAETSVAILGGMLVLLAAYLLRRILVRDGHPAPGATAWLAGILLALDPLSILKTSHVGLDGILALAAFVSVLVAALYLRTGSRASLIGAGTACGLTVATKAPGLILLPLFALLPLVAGRPREGQRALVSRRTASLVLAGALGSAILFVALLPAMWVEPIETMREILSGEHRTGSLADSVLGKDAKIFLLGRARRPGAIYYPVQMLVRATPLAILGMVLLPLSWRRVPSRAVRESGLGLLVILVVLTLASKKKWRYVTMAMPFLDVLAALGIAGLVAAIGRAAARRLAAGTVAAAVAVQGAWVLAGAPHYGLRFNPLTGGIATAYHMVRVTWGEGMEEAVRFLDREADRRGRPITWSGGYRSPYGSCGESFGSDRLRWLGRDPPGVRADYHVLYDLYTRRADRIKATDNWWMSHGTVVHRVILDGLVVAKIYGDPVRAD